MTSEATNLDIMLRAVEVMTAWNDDPELMGDVVTAQAADVGEAALLELTVGLGYLCNVLLSRIAATSEFSKLELLQILAGAFIAEASSPS